MSQEGPVKPVNRGGLPDFQSDYEKVKRFLEESDKYKAILQEVADRRTKSINIDLEDLYEHEGDEMLADSIRDNTKSYQEMLCKAVDELMPESSVRLHQPDVQDILNQHRRQTMENSSSNDSFAQKTDIPPELTRRYELRVQPRAAEKPLSLRGVKANHIGQLVTVKGIITRMSDVNPKCCVATYLCETCGYEAYQVLSSRSYTPLYTCPSESCQKNNTPGKLFPLTRGSKFLKFQDLKLQELPEEVPVGHVPQSVTVHLTGEQTRSCCPGDIVTISGIFLVAPHKGYKAMRAGLTTDTYLDVQSITTHKKSYSELQLDDDIAEQVEELQEDQDIYRKLAQSIAPEIWGNEDVKKALLCLLIGGVTRNMKDGMRIRGDINVLLMGDPGVAKSQLLRYVSKVSPRAVYTTGKGSSGVGLTAAVLRDPSTGEMSLEGGALVLADMGICCIDEFDKMEEDDRTAIHEVMEQQTVSIAKAGITTTLNARTSILAAANPVGSRYDVKRSFEHNVNLPTALLSRFDLVFILLDKANEDNDQMLAQHVTYVHMNCKHPELDFTPLSPELMRAYVARCKGRDPWVPPQLVEFITNYYVGIRQKGEAEEKRNKMTGRTGGTRTGFCTPRALLSILRFGQALARIYGEDSVSEQHVREAIRLQNAARESLETEKSEEKRKPQDKMSVCYNLIRETLKSLGTTEEGKRRTMRMANLETTCVTSGISKAIFDETIGVYAENNIFMVTANRDKICLLV